VRDSNIYRIFLEVERDPATAKRRQSTMTFRGTRPEAEAEYARLRNQRARGIELSGEKLKVADYLDRCLRDYAAVNTKPRTEKGYRQIIDCHVKPVVGSIPLGKLRPLHVQRVISTALGSGVSKLSPNPPKGTGRASDKVTDAVQSGRWRRCATQ